MAQNAASPSLKLQAWDEELAGSNVNYEKLYQEMVQASKETAGQNVEVLWRLAKVTYLASLNSLDMKLIKEKTQEVIIYAEKALALDENNFQANLWLSSAAGKLALIEDNLQARLKSLEVFLKHLYLCVKQKADDHLVLFMEGRMHLALLLLSAEEKLTIEQHLKEQNLSIPILDLAAAETKLRRSIELNPNSLDSYITLAYLLVKCKKLAEAREVIDKGLTVPRATKSDEMLAKDMEQLKARLPPPKP